MMKRTQDRRRLLVDRIRSVVDPINRILGMRSWVDLEQWNHQGEDVIGVRIVFSTKGFEMDWQETFHVLLSLPRNRHQECLDKVKEMKTNAINQHVII